MYNCQLENKNTTSKTHIYFLDNLFAETINNCIFIFFKQIIISS